MVSVHKANLENTVSKKTNKSRKREEYVEVFLMIYLIIKDFITFEKNTVMLKE